MNYEDLVDIRQTPEFNHFMQTIGWQQKKIRLLAKEFFYSCRTIPFLPFGLVKVLRARVWLDQETIRVLKQKYKTIIFKQEPFIIEKQKQGQIYFAKDKKNNWPVLPTKTLWMDLALSEKKLLANLKSKTRYNLKKAQQKLNTNTVSGDKITHQQLQDFYSLWSKNKPHNWLFKPKFADLENLVKAFGKKCFFVFVVPVGTADLLSLQPLATCLILTSPNMAFYWHNASSPKGRLLFAPTLCLWQSILESKKQGLQIFDFEGLWDERFPKLNNGWKGFTRFKLGFMKK